MKFLVVVTLLVAIVHANDWIATPFGRVFKECIHKIPNGVHIDEDITTGDVNIYENAAKEKLINQVPKCPFKIQAPRSKPSKESNMTSRDAESYDGWLAYTTYKYSGPTLTSFLGYFSVPNTNPQQTPEVLYIFTGLQNVDWIPIVDPEPPVFDIIQPVLQYPGDFGNYWSVRSWYVTLNSGVMVSDEVQTSNGANIFGNMTKIGSDTWYIGGVVPGQGTAEVTVSRQRLAAQPWAYNTLECYGCCGCSCEPTDSTKFTQLSLANGHTPVTPTWVAHTSPNPRCNELAVINSPSSVTIYFNK